MKKISILLLGLMMYSCQFSTKQNESNSTSSSVEVNLKENDERPIKQPNTIVDKRQKISKSIFILDSIKLDLDVLIDTVSKYNPNLPVIHPSELSKNLNTVFQLNDSILLIPFFIDIDFELTRFTKWKLMNESTLEYQGILKPDFMTKYAYTTIFEQVSINQNTILIGETSGGEGGENWQNLWISQLDIKDSLIEVGQYETGYEGEEYMKTLEYQVKDKEVLIYEKTDSTNYTADSLLIISINKKLVKTIELN